MNTSLYRIVFNKARGCMMAVSELASSNAKGKDKSQSAGGSGSRSARQQARGDDGAGTFGFSKPVLKAINSLVLLAMMVPTLTAPMGAYAQVRSDPNAPGNQRPTVLNSANGLPQVNIQTPNANGVSRNVYGQFDVDNRGVIINNSRTNTQTQQGGLVQGNPWLAQGSARIIVNEVNSTNPSYLNGYIEIAGQRAEIIIANPSGISVNGAGFINASSATLTTGTPIINGGNLEGYAVQKGTISINGYGLDASLTDYTGILARAVEVNAGIWANNLQIVTGANQISADQSSSTPIAGVGGAPMFALDVSSLGGMYAGKISLIGTEAGIGVRNAGYLGASGDLSINAEGILVNSGLINSSANANFSIKGSVDNSGSISAQGNATIDSKGEILNGGGISAGANLGLTSATTVKNSGYLSADGNLMVNSASGITNSGQIYASGNTSLKTGGDIFNSGMVAAQGNTSVVSTAVGGNITNTSTSILAAGMTPDGQMLNTGNLSLEADSKISAQGLLMAGNQLSVKSKSLDLSSTNLTTGALALNATGGDLNLAGAKVSVARELELTAAQTLATDSAVISAQALKIDAAKWTNTQGQILQLGATDTNITITGALDNTSGFIASNAQNMTIKAASIDSSLGGIVHAGTGQMALTTGKLGLTQGQIVSNGDLNLAASQIDGAKAALVSKGSALVNVTGEVNLAGGQVAAGKELTLNAGSLKINGGQLTSQEKMALFINGAFDNSDGLVASSNSVSLNTGALTNNAGTIAGKSLDINTNGQALSSIAGTIASSTSLNINSGALNNDTGSIQSAGNMVLNTNGQTLTNTGGDATTGKGILSQGTLTITAGDIDSSAGYLAAVGKTTIDAKNISNAAAGTLVSGDALSITASGNFNNAGGQVQAAIKVDITTQGNLDSTKGLIVSGTQIDLNVGKTLTTDSGVISATSLGITAADWNNVKGQVIQTGNTDTVITVSGALNNTEGYIASNGQNLTIQSAALNNNLGNILHANSGKLNITTGKLDLAEGQIASNGDMVLTASQIDGAKGAIVSKGLLQLDVTGAADLSGGQIGAGKDLAVTAGSLNVSEGQVTSQTKLTFTVTGATDTSKALIAANGDVKLTTGALNNAEGKIAGNTVDINTSLQSLDNTAGTIASSTTLTLNSGALNNDTGSIQSGGNMVLNTNGQGLTNTGGDPATGKGILSQATLTLDSGALNNNGGYIAAADKVTITATSLSNNAVGTGATAVKGTIISNDELTITTTVGDLANVGGQIQSTKKLSLDVKSVLDNNQGLIATSAEIDIKAGSIVNKNTKIETITDKLDADGQAVIDLATGNVVKDTKLDIKGIQAKTVKITAGNMDNTEGGILASDALTITSTGNLNNTKGMLAAGDTAKITATSLNNTEGVIQSTKNMTINTGTDVLDNTKGLIASSADVDITSGSLINKNTKVESMVNKLDSVTGLVVNDAAGNPIKEAKLDIKGIQAKNVTLSTGAIDNTDGGILANETLAVISTGVLNNTKGMLASSEESTIVATGINNTQGTIQSAKTLTIDVAGGTLINNQGLIASSTDVTINAGTILNTNTKTETVVGTETKIDIKGIQGKSVTLNANNVNNTQGGILAIHDLLIVGTGTVNNTLGIISSTGNLTIKDKVAIDDPAPGATSTVDTNVASKTQTVINTGGAIVANNKLTIDSKSLTGDGAVLNAGFLVDIMQDAAGKQVKKNAAGKWVTLDANGVPCATGCTELTDAQVSTRMIDKDGVLLKKNASGQYIKVNADGTEILVNGAAVVVADADAFKAKELTEGDVTIKLVDSFNLTSTGSIQASGNLDMRTKGDVTNAGVIQASRALTLLAENIDNKFGGEITAGATQLAANGSITNRGLIDGSFTLLQANEIINTGTGRIYGDQISISAGILTNSAEGAKSAVIAARSNMDIGAYVINNSDDSLLLSLGNMTIGNTLEANGKAVGQAEAFVNSSATVEVIGNLNISAKSLNNVDGYATTGSSSTSEDVVIYTIDSPGNSNDKQVFYGKDGTFKDWNNDPSNPEYAMFYSTLNSDPNNYLTAIGSSLNWTIERYTHTTETTGSYGTRPATISVGGSMTTDFVDGINDKSKIVVGGALTGNGDNFQNIGSSGSFTDSEINSTAQRTWVQQGCNIFGCNDTRIYSLETPRLSTVITNSWQNPAEILYNTVPTYSGATVDKRNDVTVIVALPDLAKPKDITGLAPVAATGVAGTGTVGTNSAVNGGTTVGNVATATSGASTGTVSANNGVTKANTPSPVGKVVRSSNSTTAVLPNNSLYIIQPVDKNGNPKGYLVETDPRFTQNKLWLGSDFMLKQMGYDPATQTRRLGDGFYEQKLVREQIAQLTGLRFLDDYTNDEEQYKDLMTAGVQFARDYGLIPGVALTAEQMGRLTTHIVWLVAKEVTLPDGTKTMALVPQVYALVKPGDIDGSGNLLSAKSIDLKLKGDMVNSGLMAARGNLSIDATNIANLTGTIKGLDVSLLASNDLQSIQGSIMAGNNLKISAGNDVFIKAGNVSAGGNATISAGHDLLILAQDKGRQVSANWGKLKKDKDGNDIPGVYENNDNSLKYGTYDQTGANISVGGGLSMSAGNDFYAQGTQINAGSINVNAGRDATITNALKGSFYESSSVRKQKTWWGLGNKTTTSITRNTDITNLETNWNAGNINANAGRDLTIVGGNFNAAGGINLGAGNNVNVMAAYDIKEKVSINAVKTNDFGRLLSTLQNGPNLNGTINEKATDTSTTDINSTRTAKLVTLNGGNGGVNISAGNTINLEAPKISGSSLNVNAGTSNTDGKINLIAAIDSREVSRTVSSRNTFWQSNESIGSLNQTLHMTNVNVPVGSTNFQAAGGISVQLPKGAKLPQQIATLAKQPGNEYLGDLAKRSDIDWKQVEVINKTWDYKKAGITQETAIIVAIVVTIVTAGAASSAGAAMAAAAGETVAVAATATTAAVAGTTAGAVIAGATSAAITTLATQAAIALLNNKGDISGALKELGSKENVKGLATAVITAGLVQGLGAEFGLVSGGKATLLQNLQTNLVNGVASSLISTAINGGSLEDALKNAVKNAVISAVASQGANAIGDLKLDIFSSNLAHAILGCAVGSATAGSSSGCAAGAGGAVVGHLSAQWYDTNIAGASAADIANFAKLTTALTSLVGGANAMNIAGVTSSNAVANNYLNHTQWGKYASDMAACKAKASGCSSTEEKAITASYQDISTKQNIALANCEATKNCAALRAEVALGTLTMLTLSDTKQIPIGGAVGADLGQSIGQRLANDPAYRSQVNQSIAVLNACNANPDQCTQQAIKAAAIVVFPLLGVAGVGFTASSVIYGGSIGAAGNVIGQLAANGGQPSQINPNDVAMATYTGALTYGATLWPSLFINTGGAVVTSAVNNSNPTNAGGSIAGAAAGTLIGYPVGAVIQGGLNNVLNPWYKETWKDFGYTIQQWIKPSPVPGAAGSFGSGLVQEGVNGVINSPSNNTTQGSK